MSSICDVIWRYDGLGFLTLIKNLCTQINIRKKNLPYLNEILSAGPHFLPRFIKKNYANRIKFFKKMIMGKKHGVIVDSLLARCLTNPQNFANELD